MSYIILLFSLKKWTDIALIHPILNILVLDLFFRNNIQVDLYTFLIILRIFYSNIIVVLFLKLNVTCSLRSSTVEVHASRSDIK